MMFSQISLEVDQPGSQIHPVADNMCRWNAACLEVSSLLEVGARPPTGKELFWVDSGSEALLKCSLLPPHKLKVVLNI